MSRKKSCVVLLGPTGAGKTRAALHLARNLPGEVVNFDSRQVYEDFPIITAQPAPDELSVCPHWLYGFLATQEKLTAGAHVRKCHPVISDIRARGKTPILVGGTGLYLRALLEGLAEVPPVPAEVTKSLEQQLERDGLEALHTRLQQVDAALAARIHPNDRQRTLRGLEVYEATGKPLSWYHRKQEANSDYHALLLGVRAELASLEPLLAKRIDLMLAAGALDEARTAYAKCPDPAAPGWTGIGCAELLAFLMERLSLEEATALWLRNTRAYAKRQLTWFRKTPDVSWCAYDDPHLPDRMLDLAQAFLREAP